MTTPASTPISYMPQLDALRAFAVGAVILHHLFEIEATVLGMQFGSAGVQVFFVLSGFLITGILLRARFTVDEAPAKGSLRGIFKAFYARRILRIFPLYYLIAFGAILSFQAAREFAVSILTYTINIQMAIEGSYPGMVSHLWSLAVEEQFYLIWPLVVLLVPTRYLVGVCGALILSAPLARVVHAMWAPDHLHDMLVFENMDALCLGALLAVLRARGVAADKVSNWMLLGGGTAGLILLGVHAGVASGGKASVIVESLFRLAAIVLFGWVVLRLAVGVGGPVGKTMSSPVLIYLGTISYGIYLIHNFLPPFWLRVSERLGGYADTVVVELAGPVLMTLLSVGLAAVSYRFIELPINRLKSRFQYTGSKKLVKGATRDAHDVGYVHERSTVEKADV